MRKRENFSNGAWGARRIVARKIHRPEGRSHRSGRALPAGCVFLPFPESTRKGHCGPAKTMSRSVAAFCEPRVRQSEHAGCGSHRGRFKVRRRRRAGDERSDSRKPESASLRGCRPVEPSATPSSSPVKSMIRTPIGKTSAKNVPRRPGNTDAVSDERPVGGFSRHVHSGATGGLSALPTLAGKLPVAPTTSTPAQIIRGIRIRRMLTASGAGEDDTHVRGLGTGSV